MRIRIRNGKDFYAGLFFFFIGIVTVLEARGYSVGTARNMGPGYFPILLGYLLLMIGGGTAVRGLWLKGEGLKISSIRPLMMVSGNHVALYERSWRWSSSVVWVTGNSVFAMW
jgi:hypothetical protein